MIGSVDAPVSADIEFQFLKLAPGILARLLNQTNPQAADQK
jgi:hypothetical protein